jgi:bifunctional non-homologous end joining protein LigD
MAIQTQVTIGGKTLTLSNLDKVLYPAVPFTKSHVIDYYRRIAPVLLPHLKNRPLTLKRFPDGVGKEFFYEKRCPVFRPHWMKTAALWSKSNQQHISYCLVNDLASLIWTANLACLELHTSLARFQKPAQPTAMVFDLDPGPGTDIIDCAQVALWLRDFLDRHKLKCFPKTSGSKGLQIYVPLNGAATFDQTKDFARMTTEQLASDHPEKILSRMARQLRRKKVFIDWSQNDHHKTTVCAYSLRAKDHPTVSTPIKWIELESAFKARSAGQLFFEAQTALKRADKFGDLFAPVLELRQKLPAIS